MRNNKGSSSLEHCIQSGLQIFFCLHIDTGSCLIKDQDGRIRQKCSCKRDQLLLALAEHGTALTYFGRIAVRHTADEIICADNPAGLLYLFLCGIEFSVTDIVLDGSGKNKAVLHHNSHLPAQGMNGHFGDVLVIDQYSSAVYVVETRNQVDDGAFSGSRRSYQCHALTRLYGKGHIL